MARTNPKKSLFVRLFRDRSGVSAVEFALIAPVMIAFYFGLAELCQGYMAQKRSGHVAAAVADLIAQAETISTAQIDECFDIGDLIMKPFTATPLKQVVSSVTRNNSGVVKVDWSRGRGTTARSPTSTVTTLPAGLIENGESVIMAEVTYDYDSPVDYFMPTVTRFSHVYYLRPRTVDKTLCTNC